MTKNTSRKGITAVVAIVLLLMMTIAAAALAYSWIRQMQQSQQTAGTTQLEKVTQSTQYAYSIESVRGGTGGIAVGIRNTGTIPITGLGGSNSSLYIDSVAQTSNMGLTGTIPPGEVVQIQTSIPMPPAGVRTNYKVITPDNHRIEFSCYAISATKCDGY